MDDERLKSGHVLTDEYFKEQDAQEKVAIAVENALDFSKAQAQAV